MLINLSFVTQPNMYARGILFGKMKYELGDHAIVRCPETGLEVDIEFKVKGWVGGGYNAIAGYINDTKTNKHLYELSGHWHEKMYIKDLATGKKELFFDASHAKPSFPKSRPLEEQAPRESQKLWNNTTQAIKKADQKTATDEKSRIEDEQRREAAERGEGHTWKPKLFKQAPPGDEESLDWIIEAQVDDKAPPEKQIEQILAIAPILPGQGMDNKQFQKDEQLPSQQGKPEPSQQETQSRPQQQAQQAQQTQQPTSQLDQAPQIAASGNLIDIEHGLEQTHISQPAQPAPAQPQEGHQPIQFAPADGLQQPLVPTKSETNSHGPRVPGKYGEGGIHRMDSIDGEDVFHDAES